MSVAHIFSLVVVMEISVTIVVSRFIVKSKWYVVAVVETIMVGVNL